MTKLEKGDRRKISRALRSIALAQKVIAGDLPGSLLQRFKLDKGSESPQEAADQILMRLLRLQDGLEAFLKASSSRKGRAAIKEPRIHLSTHYVKCKRSTCSICNATGSRGHGPYWMGSVRFGKEGKTHWYHLGACSKTLQRGCPGPPGGLCLWQEVKGMPAEKPAAD